MTTIFSPLDDDPIRPQISPDRPFAARPAHFPAKAKKVLVIYCSGAVSQVDTFDFKPELVRRTGQRNARCGELNHIPGTPGKSCEEPLGF